MSIFDDWMNALSKPPDDSSLTKELDRWKQINESLERGDCIKQIPFEESGIGKQLAELQKLREDFDQYRANYVADKASNEERRKRERRGDRIFAIFAGAISGIIGSAIGGLAVYYWPVIVSIFTNLFQKLPPH